MRESVWTADMENEKAIVKTLKSDDAIAQLGPMVTDLATVFEDTITIVRKQPYEEQVKILAGYKKPLEKQINVINSRIQFVKRVG